MTAAPQPIADPPVYTISAAEYRMRCTAGWIERYQRTHGHAPSLREIAAYADVRSRATVFRLLTEMRERGFLRREPSKTKTWEVLRGPATGSVVRGWTDPDLIDWHRPGAGPRHHRGIHRTKWTPAP